MLTETKVKEYLAFMGISWNTFKIWHRPQTKSTNEQGETLYPSEDVVFYITSFIKNNKV